MDTKKLLIPLFSCLLAVGCASNKTSQSGEESANAADERARQAAAAEAAARAAEDRARQEANANLQTVFYFDFDQATLSAETRVSLDAHIARLKNSNSTVRLEGHADERGTREYNMALGERRANAVANYLIINGVERYRVETVSYGEERPEAFGSSEGSWAKNRRVEIK